jgi:hybrid cluster-associated redox disulfide protein
MENVQSLGELALADLFDQFPATIPVFLRNGMACVGCDLNALYTVAEAIALYKLDRERFLAELGQACAAPGLSRELLDTPPEEKR